MITRVDGVLESVVGPTGEGGGSGGGVCALVRLPAVEVTLEVMIPAYLGERLSSQAGATVTLWTIMLLDSPNQGATFMPRLLGFGSARERTFFELLTSVKGLGNRRALRALAVEPAVMARAIASGDSRRLQSLPEIGKKLAETLIHELQKDAAGFADGPMVEAKDRGGRRGDPRITATTEGMTSAALDAVEGLIVLGETRPDAERLVARALHRDPGLAETDRILAAALGGR